MSAIEWTHLPGFKGETWNPVTGCTKVSQGCKHCYAERVFPRTVAGQRVTIRAPVDYPEFGEKQGDGIGSRPRRFVDVATHADRLARPLHWRAPRCVFVNSMSDLFHEDVPIEFIECVFAVMAMTPDHRYIVLTKRPVRMREFLADPARRLRVNLAGNWLTHPPDHDDVLNMGWPLPNVWLGVSVEDQATADERIPLLLDTPAAKRIVSYEPALGPVDCSVWMPCHRGDPLICFPSFPYSNQRCCECSLGRNGIDWLIIGGESGPGARPFNVEWAHLTITACRAAGVPVFVKQLGAFPFAELDPPAIFSGTSSSRNGVTIARAGALAIKHSKGADPSEWPLDLRVQEFPQP